MLLRTASNKRIELDQQKREAIEKHKLRELQAHKAEVASWQNLVASQGTCTQLTHCGATCTMAAKSLGGCLENGLAAADQAESDYEDEEMDKALATSTQDLEQYHGRGWRAKKAKGFKQSNAKQPAGDVSNRVQSGQAQTQTDKPDQQAIWTDNAEAEPAESVESGQSSGTAYDLETSATSRYDRSSQPMMTNDTRDAQDLHSMTHQP